jgi:Holliday junction DNA helicase RuvA
MIAFLDGKVELIHEHWLVVNVGGVGYRVGAGNDLISKLTQGDSVQLFTYTHVREDTLALYGFVTYEELELFELLLTVSGIGPKAAMNILNVASPDKIRASIVNQDPVLLSSVSGIGKKIAEKVVVELKNKVGTTKSLFVSTGNDTNRDVLDALLQLGFKQIEAHQAIANLPEEYKTTQDRLKYCLGFLNKNRL